MQIASSYFEGLAPSFFSDSFKIDYNK